MDEKRSGTALADGEECSKRVGTDWKEQTSCYNGDLGDTLLKEASAVWNKQFPDRATVPHLFVNDEDTQPEYQAAKKNICAAGSTAAVCKGGLRKIKTRFCKI